MIRQLPESANIEHLRSQAKELLRSLRRGETEALVRIADFHLEAPYRLAQAQLVVAREYGFESWAKLKRYVAVQPLRREAFFDALRAGDRERASALVSADRWLLDARDPREFGIAPIAVAARRADRPLIELLLAAGADIDARSDWWAGSFGALDFADADTSEFLLERGATLTPHAAARLGKIDALRAIIKHDPAAVSARGGDGQFPLHFASTPAIVDLLADAGADLDARDLDHCSTAAQWRIEDLAVCRRLIERGATPDLFIAAMLDDPALVDRVLDAHPDAIDSVAGVPNALSPEAPGECILIYSLGSGARPAFVAIDRGHRRAFDRILERSTRSARRAAACWMGDETTARSLAGPVADADQATLALAAWNRKTNTVGLMLELGWAVNNQDAGHSTALDKAAFHGFDDVIEVILRYGPDLTLKNAFGGTPLGCCIYGSLHSWRRDGDFARSVELLIAAGSPLPEKARGSDPVNAVLRRQGVVTE